MRNLFDKTLAEKDRAYAILDCNYNLHGRDHVLSVSIKPYKNS